MVLFQEVYLEDDTYLCLAFGYRYKVSDRTYDDNYDFGIVSKKKWVEFSAKEWPEREEVEIAERYNLFLRCFHMRKENAKEYGKALADKAAKQGGLTAFVEKEKALFKKGEALAKRFNVLAVDAHELACPKRLAEFSNFGYVVKTYMGMYDDGSDYEGEPMSHSDQFIVISNDGLELGVDPKQAESILNIIRYERKARRIV